MKPLGWIVLLIQEKLSLRLIEATVREIARFQRDLQLVTGISTTLLLTGPPEKRAPRHEETFASVLLPSLKSAPISQFAMQAAAEKYTTSLEKVIGTVSANWKFELGKFGRFVYTTPFEQNRLDHALVYTDNNHGLGLGKYGLPEDVIGRRILLPTQGGMVTTTVESMAIQLDKVGLFVEPVMLSGNRLVTGLYRHDIVDCWFIQGIHPEGDDRAQITCKPRELNLIHELQFAP